MINMSDHDYEILILHFEYLLTKAEVIGYPLSVIESRIANSLYFSELENGSYYSLLYSNDIDLYNDIFKDSKNNDTHIELNWTYNWISQAYLYLLSEFNITFELLFAYLPIKKMKEMFKLYHEMDNEQLKEYLKEQMQIKNPFKLFLQKRNMSLKTLASLTGIPLSTLSSYSQGARDIRSMSLDNGVKISKVLNIKTSSLII